jgi:hypothetical protein
MSFGAAAYAQSDNSDPILPKIQTQIDQLAGMKQVFESPILHATNDAPAAKTFSTIADARYVGTIELNPAQLIKPTEDAVELSRPVAGFGIPRQLALLRLEIDGEIYELFFASEAADPKFGFTHVAMDALNVPGAYAHFSVDRTRGLVHGTLYAPSKTYRIVPSLSKAEQFVFALGSEPGGLTTPQIVEVGDQRLAQRHQQVEAIAKIQPQRALSAIDKPLSSVKGGNLGVMRNTSAAEFVRVLRELSVITKITGAEQFKLQSVRKLSDGGKLLSYRQLIGRVPVDAQNEIAIDRSGKVELFTVQAVAVDIERTKAQLTKNQALKRATVEIEAIRGQRINELELLTPVELVYRLEDQGRRVKLVFQFDVRVSNAVGAEYRISVNAVDGSTESVGLTKSSDYGYGAAMTFQEWIKAP